MNKSDKSAGLIYQVATPSPLRRLFDYLPPQASHDPILPGTRVIVPFGRREVVGIVIANKSTSDVTPDQLKTITTVLDGAPLFSPHMLELLQWAANYYHSPLGEVLSTALPTQLRRGKALPGEKSWRLTRLGKGLPEHALQRAPRQQQALHMLQTNPSVSHNDLLASGVSAATLRILADKQLAESFSKRHGTRPFDNTNVLREPALALLPDQEKAILAQEQHGYHAYLLEGETGSGKTEVYLQAITKVLRYGRQALVLVPEINLTPQMLDRFQRRFHCAIAVIHSGLGDSDKLLAWQGAADGSAAIVIGTRSAVFTPMHNLGIIIVDEEHDSSFKQQEGFHYSARDIAVMRASRENIPILLGSATPSLESLVNCLEGRYQHQRLVGRPGSATQPVWQLIDIRKLRLNTGFSRPVIEAIGDELSAGHQVLVFLNRRGFAPTLMCHDCGWVSTCRRCDARLTFHQSGPLLLCHHCEYREPLPSACPACSGQQLQHLGQGTERGEAILEVLFPETPVIRVDRDTTRRKDAMAEVISEVGTGKPCIVVGTQMLAKGHHFPNVTLVVILDADSGLYSPDFRATERMGQLITQVAGRAGRGEAPGRVMIQSHNCDHPLLNLLARHEYHEFAQQILAERRLSAMPPFASMALLRADAPQRGKALTLLKAAREHCETIAPSRVDVRYLGPFAAPLEYRNGRYRYQLLIITDRRKTLHSLLGQLHAWLESARAARQVRWSLDVDPQDMA